MLHSPLKNLFFNLKFYMTSICISSIKHTGEISSRSLSADVKKKRKKAFQKIHLENHCILLRSFKDSKVEVKIL